ncbi:MAG TPA: VWA domain-containing protein [Terracidiphilus sp.]|nr:VWA domain-containing protein [Terracidiphilus sp.]
MPRGAIRFSHCQFLLFALVCSVSIPNVLAQVTPSGNDANQPTIQFKAESNLVLVRVVVRDANGHPVEGLKKEDFRVFDRGKEQTISQFEEESEPGSGAIVVNPGAAPTQPQLPGKLRFFALYFDSLDTNADEMIQARDAADEYFAGHLGPNDRVAVLTTDKVLTDFTSDSKQIHEALFKLQSSAAVGSRVHECPDLTDYQAAEILETNDLTSDAWRTAWAEAKTCPARSFAADGNAQAANPDTSDMVPIRMIARRVLGRAAIQTRRNLDSLRQLVRYVAKLQGERAVLLVSPGFLSQSAQYELDRVIDSALRSQVVVDTLDPKGLRLGMREADASQPSAVLPDPKAVEARHNLDAEREFSIADVMAELAQGTGGEFIHNENDLRLGLEALAGQQGRYVLAFVPTEMKRDGKFHELKVALAEKRRGYTLESRRGYYVPKEGEEAGNAKEEAAATPPPPAPAGAEAEKTVTPIAVPPAESEIDDALKSQTDSDALPVGMEVQTGPGQLSVLTHLDVRPLPLKKDGGRNQNELTFVAAVFDQDNKAVQVKERHAKVDLSEDQLADFLNDGVEVRTAFVLKPGTYRLRIVVTEADENKVATLSRQVTVP